MSENDEFEDYEKYFLGRKLTAERAATLKRELSNSPHDLLKRIELFGYHSTLGGEERFDRALVEDLLWFVENMPGIGGIVSSYFYIIGGGCSDDDYKLIKELLARKLVTSELDPMVWGNAGEFSHMREPEYAAPILEKALALYPKHSWAFSLFLIYWGFYKSATGARKVELSGDIVRVGIIAIEGSPRLHIEIMPQVSWFALSLGKLEECERLAENLVRMGHSSHLKRTGRAMLGLVALRKNRKARACEYLIASEGDCRVMAACKLAGELVEAGETAAVLEFLELSKRKVRRDLRERWSEQARRGEVPDFGIDPSGFWLGF